MYLFDTVFVHLFHDQAGTVFCGDLFTLGRKMLQGIYDNTADGIVILRFNSKTDHIIEILQLTGALYQIFAFAKEQNLFFFSFVKFIADITDDLLN